MSCFGAQCTGVTLRWSGDITIIVKTLTSLICYPSTYRVGPHREKSAKHTRLLRARQQRHATQRTASENLEGWLANEQPTFET